MKPLRDYAEHIPLAEFIGLLKIDRKTAYRWRHEGRGIELDGYRQVIVLKAINTAGPHNKGGKVLVPLSHDERRNGLRYLGAFEFIDALRCEPVLRGVEMVWGFDE